MVHRRHNLSFRQSRAGFTIVEMLVVLAIIVMLIGVLIVALGKAAASGQSASTSFLMSSITSAVSQFQGDHGYAPPILGDNGTPADQPGWARDAVLPGAWSDTPSNSELSAIQQWHSITSLAEYLIGYGGRDEDGYGVVGDVTTAANPGRLESPAIGLRSPGKDGVWGAVFNPRPGGFGPSGGFFKRNPSNAGTQIPAPYPNVSNNNAQINGRVYGPYLELKDSKLLGGLRPDGTIAGPEEPDFDQRPKVILDYWGTPIRYYRRPYRGGDPSITAGGVNLGDVFALRPWTFNANMESDGAADGSGDTSTTPELKAALYALLSAGPNRSINFGARVDNEETNRDNLMEVGN
jgi:prepilin-type N-terminal cleavage/methylation domain-containing protein